MNGRLTALMWSLGLGVRLGQDGQVRMSGLSALAPSRPDLPAPECWSTPAGTKFIMAAPPFVSAALESWSVAQADREGREGSWPVLAPALAWSVIREIEHHHLDDGFYVKPGWRGLAVPENWPPDVGLSLQSLYLAATYGPEVLI